MENNSAMEKRAGRRWFRFSLRTMFVTVTVIACWLGWQSKIVRDRKGMLSEVQDNAAFDVSLAEEKRDLLVFLRDPPPKTIPLARRWLGDQAVQTVVVTRHLQGFSEELLARLEKTFPEAEFLERHAEPCHPACFPRGTLIATPGGLREVEKIVVGDLVTTILPAGTSTATAVQSIFTTENRLWQVETDAGTIMTTETQPLCTLPTEVTPAGKLTRGDSILIYRDGEVGTAQVVSATATQQQAKVFNLVLGGSEVFVANGFLARSKPPAEVGASP